MNSKRIFYSIYTVIITACASHGVTIPGSSITPEEPGNASTPTNTVTEWIFRPQRDTRRYQSQSLTVITTSDTRQRRTADTIQLTLQFSLTTDDLHKPSSIMAYIDSIETNKNITYNHLLPFKLVGTLSPTVFNLETEKTTSPCNPQAIMLSGEVRPALVVHPLHIYKDSNWVDSTSATCTTHGLTNARILREYHVAGQTTYHGSPVILIQRKETTHFSQQDAQTQHLVDTEGDGTGISNIYIEVETGVLRALDGRYSTKITTTASGRTTNFTQVVNQTIVLAH